MRNYTLLDLLAIIALLAVMCMAFFPKFATSPDPPPDETLIMTGRDCTFVPGYCVTRNAHGVVTSIDPPIRPMKH